MVSSHGQVIRIPAKSAKLLGRDTQGVRLMRLDSKDHVASVTVGKDEEKVNEANQTEASQSQTATTSNGPKLEVKRYDDR
jgi:DNA gyrase/topoisomerase IV subunit A